MPFYADVADDERDVCQVNDTERELELGLWECALAFGRRT